MSDEHKRTRQEAMEAMEAQEARYSPDNLEDTLAELLNLPDDRRVEWRVLGATIQRKLEAAVRAGCDPAGVAGQELTALHREWFTFGGGQYNAAMHKGLTNLWMMDARFAAYYDRKVPGCARFLRNAVRAWARDDQ